ncbi:hypothetical protein [Pseudomonas sp. BN414]|uniref:hypothetical protein n=1 Tax=Pseudomonas sp. BN414 TaxID=2567888 RepID=UPI002456E9E2|nr:hypothetical protein [Pseudomonas sp. BN414]
MTVVTLTDEMLQLVWGPETYDKAWKAECLVELRDICETSGTKIGEWLCGRRSQARFSNEELRALEGQLESVALRNRLREVTIRVRKFRPDVPLARIAIEVHRAANPVNPDRYTTDSLQASRGLVEALKLAIRRDIECFTPEARVGLLLLSAAYYGGLLDIPQLEGLARLTLKDIVWIAGIPETRLVLSIRGQPDAEQRQWFPDPTTLALMVRCESDLAGLRPVLARQGGHLRCIRALLRAVGVQAQAMPSSLEQMFELLRIQLQVHLPQLLVNYMRRLKYVSHSVLPSAWGFVQGQLVLPDEGSRRSRSKVHNQVPPAAVPPWLKQLCRQVRKRLLKPVDHIPPPGNHESLIRSWAAHLLHGRSFHGHPLAPKTIAGYVRDVGRGLTDMLSVASILELSPDALELVYEMMLDAQPTPATRRNLSRGLLEFHSYLQRHFSYPPISPYSVLGIGKTPQAVDAQIISEDQYRQVLAELAVGPLALRSPRLVTIARALVILGFRLGLRRNEALKLLRCDLQLPVLSPARASAICLRHPYLQRLTPAQLQALDLPVSLHIRPHAQRALKTRSSTRTLPLHVFLEPDELKLITTLAEERDAEEARGSYSPYLFCVPELHTHWVSEASLFPAIHDALRRVTGCGELHYHHLRHSCASWLTFKLAAAAWGVSGNVDLLFGELNETRDWLRDHARLTRQFFHSECAPTRRVVHIVSAVLGHASPRTSLLHYIHSMPWLAALCWQWNPARWPAAYVMAKIAGVSLPTKPCDVQEQGQSSDIIHMQQLIGRVRTLKAARNVKASRLPIQPESRGEGYVLGRLNRIATMLAYESYAESTGHPVNLDWLEFPESDRSMMLERAKYIRSLGSHRLSGPHLGSHYKPIPLVPRLPKHGGLTGVVPYAESLYELLSGPKHAKASRALDDFVERCWATDTTLRFYQGRDEECAREYVWLLNELGIDNTSIEFIIYDPYKRRNTGAFWRKVLGMPRLKFSAHRPENPNVENGHIGIRVRLQLPASTDRERGVNHHSGAALRYLMLMASIDWHERAVRRQI